jgi:adenosine deaminase
MSEDNSETSQHAKLPLEFFQKLPKTDLHVHLDGSLRLETIVDLAKRHRHRAPLDDPAELRRIDEPRPELRLAGRVPQGLRRHAPQVMQNEDALFRVAYELAEDAARENVRYMEVRYAPMLHTRLGLRITNVVEAVLAGLRAAHDTLGIESNVIVCGIRNISPQSSLEMAELAVAYKGRGVVGFDLAGAEYDHPAKHHKAAFQLVRDNNINCTIHAGEAYGPESIAQALHVCGAHRIGHGCRLREDGDLLALHQRSPHPARGLPVVERADRRRARSRLAPDEALRGLGLRVTVNTDNRLVTDTTVSHELWHCHTKMGMTLKDIKSIVVAGFKSAFLPFHVKQAYLRRVTEELERFTSDGVVKPMPPPSTGYRAEVLSKPEHEEAPN